VSIEFIDVIKAFTQLNSLFRRDGTIDCVLDHVNGSFTAFVNERRNIELFSGMCQDVFGNGSGGFAEYVCENIPREIISGCGVPIRQKFFQTTDPVQAKLQFGIAPEHRHLVVMGGSMGCGPIPSLTGALLRALPEDCEVTVVCGTNKTLLAALHRAHADIPRFHARGYVTDMPALLDSADLYLTKPGGLSTTEAAVRHLPMVLIDAVAGCEEHNMNFFVSTGGAKAARSVPMLTQLCVELLHNDAARQEMRDRLRERNFGNAALRIYEATVLQAGQ